MGERLQKTRILSDARSFVRQILCVSQRVRSPLSLVAEMSGGERLTVSEPARAETVKKRSAKRSSRIAYRGIAHAFLHDSALETE
jgi:hypothetical protein